MAFDAFLKIDGIKGESTDRSHPDEIVVLSFAWGVTQAGSPGGGGGGGAGKASFQDFHFNSVVHKGSPLLAASCATGKHLASALLSLRASGQKAFDFLKIKLEDVLVSSYEPSYGGGEKPNDEVSLNFARIRFDYQVQKADGSPGDLSHFGFDVKQNKPV